MTETVDETRGDRGGYGMPSSPQESWIMWLRGTWVSDADWDARHRIVMWVLVLHWPALVLLGVYGGTDRVLSYAQLEGYGWGHSVLEGSIPVVFALVASITALPRRLRSAVAGFGLITTSAIFTHFSGGFIEAHFHFFVMVGLSALYVDWVPFGATVLFVLLHHGVVGTLYPEDVFNHPTAIAHPWRWAAIHAFFIAAMGATQVANLVLIGKKMRELALSREMSGRVDQLV